MKSNDSSKSVVERWKEETAHLTPAEREQAFQILLKANAARKARLEAAAKTKGKTP
jgi:hypothetical protein